MTITLKDMKLIFNIDASGETWERRVEDMDGNLIWSREEPLLQAFQEPDMIDAWETQMRSLPVWNIVEHERNFV